jgi:putative membrane protein
MNRQRPSMKMLLLVAALLTLALLWFGPLPRLAATDFTAHMTMHMGVVALAAPLLAAALAGGPLDPVRRHPVLFGAVAASVVELVVVWAWHAPALHHAARMSAIWLTAEQSMFLIGGFSLWISSLGGDRTGSRAGAGVVALLLTSMHMTLLGSLIALSPRPLYTHAGTHTQMVALEEQQRGGAIMLVIGGASYLTGGLLLSARLLDRTQGKDASSAAGHKGSDSR